MTPSFTSLCKEKTALYESSLSGDPMYVERVNAVTNFAFQLEFLNGSTVLVDYH